MDGRKRLHVAAVVLVAVAAVAAGAILLRVAWLAIYGRPSAPTAAGEPLFRLPGGKTLVAVVEESDGGRTAVTRLAEGRLAELAAARGLGAEVVPPERLTAYRAGAPDYGRLSVIEIGRGVGADLVVYAVVQLTPAAGGGTVLTARVRVVSQGGRLWPEDLLGHRVSVTTPRRPGQLKSPDAAAGPAADLAEAVADCFGPARASAK